MANFKAYPSTPELEAFWKVYPKKHGKGDAKKAWHQTEGVRPDVHSIVKAVVAMCSSKQWMKDDGEYIPLPATWLRREGWDDVPQIKMPNAVNGKSWWESSDGVMAKAQEHGLSIEQFQKKAYKILDETGKMPLPFDLLKAEIRKREDARDNVVPISKSA